MSNPLDKDGVTTPGWSDLVDEFDQWGADGRVATLWWRDDDAAIATKQLDRFTSIVDDTPIALAVIPAASNLELAAWLARRAGSPLTRGIAVLQHGWRHANRAVNGKKSEFPPERSSRSVATDLAAGRARLAALFGVRALAVLVPPWNRFDPRFFRLLPDCGFRAISCVRPRAATWPVPGILEVNVHVDLVAWAGNCSFIGEKAALGAIIGHLRARRRGEVDSEEPTGILTHHLVQDAATEVFLSRLVAITREHSATRWLGGAEVFPEAL
jgi:peptidoglycan/xylan/chitin deacetylase (PgdA/CDA1 family)